MAIYYVRPTNGLDTNSGLTFALAFKSTQKAVDIAIAGDTVRLVAESIELVTVKIDLDINNGTASSPIGFMAVDTSDVRLPIGSYYTLQCSGTPINLLDWNTTLGGQYVHWFNVNFDGAIVNTGDLLLAATSGDGDYNVFKDCRIQRSGGRGAYIRGSGLVFTGCEVDNNASGGLITQSGFNSRWGYGHVVGCKIHDNTGDGLFMSEGARCVSNNLVYGNSGNGILLGNNGALLRAYVEYNTVYNNGSNGIALNVADPLTIGLLNNTLVDNGAYGIDLLTTVKHIPSMDFNHYSGNTSGAVRHNNASVSEANVNSNGNIGANNQVGTTATNLFTNISAGTEDFTPKNGVILDGNGINGSDIGALPAADAAGGGGGAIVNQGIHSIDSGIVA